MFLKLTNPLSNNIKMFQLLLPRTFLTNHRIFQQTLDHKDAFLVILVNAYFFHDIVVGFSLGGTELGGSCQGNDHEGDHDVAKDAREDGNYSPQGSQRIEISIAYCCHSDYCTPEGIPQIRPILLTYMHIRQFCFPQSDSEDKNRDEKRNCDDLVRPFFEFAFNCKESSTFTMTFLANLLCSIRIPFTELREENPE